MSASVKMAKMNFLRKLDQNNVLIDIWDHAVVKLLRRRIQLCLV